MKYEEQARIKKTKASFNAAASLYNMIAYAKQQNDSDELEILQANLENSPADLKADFEKIENTLADTNEQEKLIAHFGETANQIAERKIAPSETPAYATNHDFYRDALLISFMADSGINTTALKDVEDDARALADLGVGYADVIEDNRGWELEEQKAPAFA